MQKISAIDKKLVFAGLAATILLILAAQQGATRLAIAAAIGLFAGLALYHASFGFTAAWRRFSAEGLGAGLRAQILLLLLTAAITYPLLAHGGVFGLKTHGFVMPFGLVAACGAFIFGIGMQLGGSCASGTLFTVGGGSTRMLITLAMFIAGSLLGTAHLPELRGLPSLPAISLVRTFGPITAYLITFAVLAAVYWLSIHREKKRYGQVQTEAAGFDFLHGPWPKMIGALALVFVSVATLLTLSRPWGITGGFALWGAKIAYFSGMDVADWPYWSGQVGRLQRSVFADATSVMNFGIVIGAFAAACLAGRFAPKWQLSRKDLLTAIIGGLMMGYGARLAYGCNIGAYLGGVISGSVHGWGWLVFGFIGSLVGTRLQTRIQRL